ncbi:MAG: type II toxin-antitoxin system RelE/ParE family toxin [Deltaproteobacteria bacterium]|nr:type II toxin-antitoxin system RelE/ParE family toxin [Deltaproteobacteria bacterium]
MVYRVELKPSADKALGKLTWHAQRRVGERIESLAADPRPPGVEKLAGEDELYRVRVGEYRVLYSIRDEVLLVLVVRIGHRRDVYRGL